MLLKCFKSFILFLILSLSLVSFSWAKEAMQVLPVPKTVSPQLQKYITSTPLFTSWNAHPKDAKDWKALVRKVDEANNPKIEQLKAKMGVESQLEHLGGVPVYRLKPKSIASKHQGKVLLHLHGGGYVFNPGETGTEEGILMASFGHIEVISVDYRMVPDHPYPAALDDALTVYQELLKTYKPSQIGVFGSSTGGGLTLALTLKAKDLGLPLPCAIAPGSPWSDLNKIGDTYFTHEGQDNILVSYDGVIHESAKLYANGHDLSDPYLSPVYGDVHGFPPVLLTSGTRDLFLSNTVRMHLKLREAGVIADLIVFEGMSHIMYMIDPDVPEVRWHFTELTRFFDRYFK